MSRFTDILSTLSIISASNKSSSDKFSIDARSNVNILRSSIGKFVESIDKNFDKVVRDASIVVFSIYRDLYGRLAAQDLMLTEVPDDLDSDDDEAVKKFEQDKATNKKKIIGAYFHRYHELLAALDVEGYNIDQTISSYERTVMIMTLSKTLIERFYPELDKKVD